MVEMKKAMPEYHKYDHLVIASANKSRSRLTAVQQKLSEFDALAKTQKDARQDRRPGRPSRDARSGRSGRSTSRGCIFFGFALGSGLVCFLEHLDHSVKVPEHLTAGLALPLFGVVPGSGGRAADHRGGHLWTPGMPDSIEADAYRNLRASLLGVAGSQRADRHAAGHQRQGGRGQEHHRPEPGRHLRPGRRTDPARGRGPPPPEPGEVFPHEDGQSAWSTSSAATSPGSGRWSRPSCLTSTSCRRATPATCRSRSWAAWNSASFCSRSRSTITTG